MVRDYSRTGETVICTSNINHVVKPLGSDVYTHITIGKMYEINFTLYDTTICTPRLYYYLYSDNGYVSAFPADMFITISENREEKLNKLFNESR